MADQRNVLASVAPNFVRPFDPAKDSPRDVGLGGPSTEYLITEQAPDGSFWNIPSIWWDRDGAPILLDADAAMQMAVDYEARTGHKFPRFSSPGAGAFSAMNRSAMGGATDNALASLNGWRRY